jgi:selenocysteine lyase/cysteine desulfurase
VGTSFKEHYSRFLSADPDRLHVAAHSHHLWPDVTFEAQIRAWEVAARLADRKWDEVFGDLVPQAQRSIARTLGLPQPTSIAIAPNTHELFMRIYSCLEPPVRILTTDGEFHSFRRQARRLEEAGRAVVAHVPVEPFESFGSRFAATASAWPADLIYVSQVFYDSGFALPSLDLPRRSAADAIVVIDGYHGFMALPTDLSALASRAFYLAGGYKYAMSGEGMCFAHCPPGVCARPVDTGWFAGFAELESAPAGGPVGYGEDGSRMLGATFDPTPLFRFTAVMGWLDDLGLAVGDIHRHVQALQDLFLDQVDQRLVDRLVPDRTWRERGHFLTFRFAEAAQVHERLLAANVVTDHRGDRLRIGFGLYNDEDDVDRLLQKVGPALNP